MWVSSKGPPHFGHRTGRDQSSNATISLNVFTFPGLPKNSSRRRGFYRCQESTLFWDVQPGSTPKSPPLDVSGSEGEMAGFSVPGKTNVLLLIQHLSENWLVVIRSVIIAVMTESCCLRYSKHMEKSDRVQIPHTTSLQGDPDCEGTIGWKGTPN